MKIPEVKVINQGQRWAVLVGIDSYSDRDTAQQKNIAYQKRLAEVLSNRYGYQADHILTYYNADATARNFYRLYDKLAKEMGPDDSFFIFISGDFIGQNDQQHFDKSSRSTGQYIANAPASPLIYFIPFDGAPDEPFTWIELGDIFSSVFKLPMKELFFVMDDCMFLPESYEKIFANNSSEKKLNGSFLMNYSCKSSWNSVMISNKFSEALVNQLKSPEPSSLTTVSAGLLAKNLQYTLNLHDVRLSTLEIYNGFNFYPLREHIDPAITGQMGPDNPIDTRLKAIDALVKFVNAAATTSKEKITHEAIVQHLNPIIQNTAENQQVRIKAIGALGRLDHPETIENVAALLKSENEFEIHFAAFNALKQYPADKALPVYRSALQNQHAEIRINAIRTLAFIPDTFSSASIVNLALTDKNESVRIAAIEVLPQFEPLSPDQLARISLLLSDEHSDKARAAALNTLSKMQAGNIRSGIADILIRSKNFELREAAAYALAEISDSIGNALSETALVNALKSDTSSRVRDAAAFALGKYGGRAAENQLVLTVKDRRNQPANVRVTAIYSLGQIKSHKAVKELIELIQDENSQIRLAAIQSLGSIGSESAISYLYTAMKDENYYVREAAQKSIADIQNFLAKGKQQDYIKNDLKDTLSRIRLDAVTKIGELKDSELIPYLVPLMADKDYVVRETTIRVLSKFTEPVTVQNICSILEATESMDFMLRVGAARVLGAIGDEKYIPVLFKRLDDRSAPVRSAVLNALGEMEDRVVIDSLYQAIADPNLEVRRSAAAALANQCFRLLLSPNPEDGYKVGEQTYNLLKKNLGAEDAWTRWFDLLTTRRADPASGISMEFQQPNGSPYPNLYIELMEGLPFNCVIDNKSQNEVFISIIDLTSDGKITVVGSAFVPEGESLSLPLNAYKSKSMEQVFDAFKIFITPFRLDFQQLLETHGKKDRNDEPLRFSELISTSLKSIGEKSKSQMDSWHSLEAYLKVTSNHMAAAAK